MASLIGKEINMLHDFKIEGAKTLSKEPDYLKGMTEPNDLVVEMGSLSNYKKVMDSYEDFTEACALESMENGTWSGVWSWKDYITLLEEGDIHVMNKIRVETGKQLADLDKRYQEVLTNYKFDVVGQFFDVGLVLTGVPETWLEPEIEEDEKLRVNIMINGTFPDDTDLDTVIQNAAKLLAMVKILEDHGVEVSLKIALSVKKFKTGYNGNFFVITNVKDYDEAINYSKASSLISPTYLRRGMMKMMEIVAGYNLNTNYGRPSTPSGMVRLDVNSEVEDLEKRLFKGGE